MTDITASLAISIAGASAIRVGSRALNHSMGSQEELLQQLGSPYTTNVVPRLHRFAFVPENLVERLAHEALTEHWGNNNFVLRKYLAVHVPWAIEQGRFTLGENQL